MVLNCILADQCETVRQRHAQALISEYRVQCHPNCLYTCQIVYRCTIKVARAFEAYDSPLNSTKTIIMLSTKHRTLLNARLHRLPITLLRTRAQGAAVDESLFSTREKGYKGFFEVSASPHLQFLKLNQQEHARTQRCSRSLWQLFTTVHHARTGRCGRSFWQPALRQTTSVISSQDV